MLVSLVGEGGKLTRGARMERTPNGKAVGHLPASGLSVLRSRNFPTEDPGAGTDSDGTQHHHQSPAPRSLSASRISRLSFLSTSSRSFTGGAKAVHVEGRRPETAMSTTLPRGRSPPPPAAKPYTAIAGGFAVQQASQQVIDIISGQPEEMPSRSSERPQAVVDAVSREDVDKGLSERFPFLSARKSDDVAVHPQSSPGSARRTDRSGTRLVARQLYRELGAATRSTEASFQDEGAGGSRRGSREDDHEYHNENGSLDTPSGPRSFPMPQPSHRQAQIGGHAGGGQSTLLLRAVLAWKGIVVASKGMSKLLDAVRRHARRVVLSRSLRAWYSIRKDGFAELVMANAYQRVQLFELKLVFRFECILLARCFLHWRSFRETMRRTRADAISLDISRRGSTAKASLWAWWISARSSTAAADVGERMNSKRLCTRSFRGWRRECRAMSAAAAMGVSAAFQAWRYEARLEARACVRAASRQHGVERSILVGFFESWLAMFRAVRKSQRGCKSLMWRLQKDVERGVFDSWRLVARAEAGVRHGVKKAWRHSARKVTKKCLVAWFLCLSGARKIAAGCIALEKGRDGSLLAAVVGGWRTLAFESVVHIRLLSRWHSRRPRAESLVFGEWKDCARREARLSRMRTRAVRKACRMDKGSALFGWSSVVKRGVRVRLMVERMRRRMIDGGVESILRGWREHAMRAQVRFEEAGWLQHKAKEVIRRAVTVQARSSFSAWRGWANEQPKIARTQCKIRKRFERASKVACFGAWRRSTIRSRRLRTISACVSRLFSGQVVASAFWAWSGCVVRRARNQAVAVRCVRRLEIAVVARAVDAWASVTLRAARQLTRLERAAQWTIECSFARLFDQVRFDPYKKLCPSIRCRSDALFRFGSGGGV